MGLGTSWHSGIGLHGWVSRVGVAAPDCKHGALYGCIDRVGWGLVFDSFIEAFIELCIGLGGVKVLVLESRAWCLVQLWRPWGRGGGGGGVVGA